MGLRDRTGIVLAWARPFDRIEPAPHHAPAAEARDEPISSTWKGGGD
jgi:hypothetical protein